MSHSAIFSRTLRFGAENTQQTADSRPDRAALSRPKFAFADFPASRGFGLDGQSGNAWRTSVCVFSHPAHPLRLKSVGSGFQQFKQELETMPMAITPMVRPAAHTTNAANDGALSTSPDLIQLHLAATNALAESLRVLRTSECTAQDLARAISRARRGLTNLKRMAAIEVTA